MISTQQEPLLNKFTRNDYLLDGVKIILKPIKYYTIEEYLKMCVGSTEEYLNQKDSQNLGKYIYCLEITCQNKYQRIYRRLRDFQKLYDKIIQYYQDIPLINESLVRDPNYEISAKPESILEQINIYFQSILKKEQGYINKQPLLNFLELNMTQKHREYQTIKECIVYRQYPNQNQQLFSNFFGCCQIKKEYTLYIIKDKLWLYQNLNGKIDFFGTKEPLNYDQNIKIKFGIRDLGIHKGVMIEIFSQSIIFRAKSLFQMYEIVRALMVTIPLSQNFSVNRYLSFATIRLRGNTCQWFIDGKDYFDQIHKEFYKAQDQIFISSSILCPEFILKRPTSHTQLQDNRLDYILKRLGDRGIKIFIQINQESNQQSMNKSIYIKKQFENSKNIYIQVHQQKSKPQQYHNEKLIIIDQQVAFIGGMDIAYGRWDTNQHQIYEQNPFETNWPGIDYLNFYEQESLNIYQFNKSSINITQCPRMPWHDIGVKLQGLIVRDLASHFIQFWYSNYNNYIKEQNEGPNTTNIIKDNNSNINIDKSGLFDFSLSYFTLNHTSMISTDKQQVMQQQTNSIILQQKNNLSTNSSNVTQYIQQRLSSRLLDKIHTNKSQDNKDNTIFSDPQNFHDMFDKIVQESSESIINYFAEFENGLDKLSLIISNKSISHHNTTFQFNQENQQNENQQEIQNIQQTIEFPCFRIINSNKINYSNNNSNLMQCQILRSISHSQLGIETNSKENSIYVAYIESIENSKHYIYIESQLFISDSAGTPINNKIATALILRIKKAYYAKQKFRVIIVKPLLQAHQGGLESSLIQCLFFVYEQSTLFRGSNSIYKQLEKAGINPSDYIQVYGLRTHSVINGVPVTQIIHVNSKLLIVDDKYAIVGTANIHDRNLDGACDTDIAVIVEDQSIVQSQMDGNNYQAAKFALTLRKELFKEHFCLNDEINQDPLSDTLWQLLQNQTQHNTVIYRQIFNCFPDDNFLTFQQMNNYMQNQNLELYSTLKDQIVGFAVQIPQHFLDNENLKLKLLEKQQVFQELYNANAKQYF